MKAIVLAEKPSVAREYARVLNCRKKAKGYFEGQDYIVTWALGHLVTLAEPGDYDKKYREWRIEDLPILPEKMRFKVIRNSAFQFRIIRSLIQRKDTGEFIIATDAGREGELVARWIMILGGWKGPVKRLWISSQTDSAIKAGFTRLQRGSDYDHLFNAALGRAEADWLIGLNVTRALTCKFDAQLSAGRVQTPTLALIIAREEELKNFKPVDYWTLKVRFGGFEGEWRNPRGNNRLFTFQEANDLKEKVISQTGVVIKVLKETKTEPPPAAYDLTELQREANKQYGFSAKKTLSTLQGLYETHKLVTYPRTDSRYITNDIVSTLPVRLKAISRTSLGHLVEPLLNSPPRPGKWFVNPQRVSDHHAIIPTEQEPQMDRLTTDEKKIYQLIVKRFIVVLYPFYKYEQTVLVMVVAGEKFHTKIREEKQKGWRTITQGPTISAEDQVHIGNPGNIRKGEKVKIEECKIIKLKTIPPARYTEATLLTAMEFPGKFVENKDLRDSINENGLGTPATRADIIEKLIATDYIERRSKELVPTSKGYQLIDLVPDQLKSAELTARWELRLTNIARGRERKDNFIADIRKNADALTRQVKADTRTYKAYNLTKNKCPVCSKFMLLVNAQKGKVLKCSDRTCGYVQEREEKNNMGFKRSRRDAVLNKRLINRYSDHKKTSGSSLGSLLEAVLDKRQKK